MELSDMRNAGKGKITQEPRCQGFGGQMKKITNTDTNKSRIVNINHDVFLSEYTVKNVLLQPFSPPPWISDFHTMLSGILDFSRAVSAGACTGLGAGRRAGGPQARSITSLHAQTTLLPATNLSLYSGLLHKNHWKKDSKVKEGRKARKVEKEREKVTICHE